MHALIPFFRTKAHRFTGCTPLSPAERMARYSQRHAEDMQQRENAGVAAPKARVVDGREVLVALPGRINHLPNQLPGESANDYEARMQAMRARRLAMLSKDTH